MEGGGGISSNGRGGTDPDLLTWFPELLLESPPWPPLLEWLAIAVWTNALCTLASKTLCLISTLYVFIIIITGWGMDIVALFPELTRHCTVAECKAPVLVGTLVVVVFPSLVVFVVVGWVGIGLSRLSWVLLVLVGYVLVVAARVARGVCCVAHWCGLVAGHRVACAWLPPLPSGWRW